MRLQLQEQRLDAMLKEIAVMSVDNGLQTHFARYFCVLVSGLVENTIKELIVHYHAKGCKTETASYIADKIKSITNLDVEKVSKLLASFSSDWALKFGTKVSEESLTALNNIYAQRNKIAHGDSFGSNITYKNVSEYYVGVKEVLGVLSTLITR